MPRGRSTSRPVLRLRPLPPASLNPLDHAPHQLHGGGLLLGRLGEEIQGGEGLSALRRHLIWTGDVALEAILLLTAAQLASTLSQQERRSISFLIPGG